MTPRVCRTQFEAQCVLANKKESWKWRIILTENGWWFVVKINGEPPAARRGKPLKARGKAGSARGQKGTP